MPIDRETLQQLRMTAEKSLRNGYLFIIMRSSQGQPKRKISPDSPAGDVIYRADNNDLVRFYAKDVLDYCLSKSK